MRIAEEAAKEQGRFDADPCIVHHFSSGVYARQMKIQAGFRALSHSHPYDHLSVLASGKVIVRTDDESKEYAGLNVITIKKDTNHEITALEDSVWLCIHATDCTDENEIDEVLINK